MDAYPKDLRQLQKFGDAYVKKSRETVFLMMLGFALAMQPISPPDSLIHSPTSSPMALSPQHMVISPPPKVIAGLRVPPAGAPSQSPYQHAVAPWLQSGAFAQASPLTFAMMGQAAAQPLSQATQFS